MNNYDKLRPWTEIESCDCESVNRILLVYTLTDNPIHCYECKGEIDPERLKLLTEQVEDVANWCSVFGALYNLWIDSGEYEDWAKIKLLDKQGQVNRQGLSIAANLSKMRFTYYWWFHDSEDPVPVNCPNCNLPLDDDDRHGHGKCDTCLVVA